jgi:hypothetical protein
MISALWYILGFAMERRRYRQRWMCIAPDSTTKGWGSPLTIAPGQRERYLVGHRVLTFLAEVHVRVCPSGTSVGESHGSGRVPCAGSSFIVERRSRSMGA